MINKVFFPATFITQPTAAAITRRLGRFAIYQPIMGQTPGVLEHLSGALGFDIRHPVIGKEAHILDLCRAYGNWGDVHQKDALRLNRLAGDGFYNQDFAVEISTEIVKGKNGGESDAAPQADPLVNARMFLQLAQEFDIRESDIRQSLEKTDNASKALFEQLRGETLSQAEYPAAAEAGASDDAGAVMTEARLTAWALLAKNDTTPPDILVTDSRAVMDGLIDRFPTLTQLKRTTGASDPETAEQAFSAFFQSIADTPSQQLSAATEGGGFSFLDHPADDGFVFEIYVIPALSSENVLASLTGTSLDEARAKAGPGHTFICLVSKSRE